MTLKYAVIGTGAIGGYYGGMLAHAGKEVHFLSHSDYEFVKQNGLKVDSTNGNFLINPIHAYDSTEKMPVCDVVLVGLKTTNNYLLKTLLPPLLHKDTVVILIQNGLGIEEDLQQDFPELHIAGGLAFICSNKIGKGYIQHLDYGRLTLGSYSCPDSEILNQVKNDFIKAGVEVELTELEPARWKKLVWNIPYNGMTVALDTTTDKLMGNENTYQLLYELMTEVIQAANRVGKGRFAIEESYAEEMLSMTSRMTPYSPSMKLDYDYRRPLEIEYIYTRPLAEAMKAGYTMSRVSMLEKQLRFIQARYIGKDW